MPKIVDWTAIEAEYIATDTTAAKLGEKYGIPGTTVGKKCAELKWRKKRQERREADAKAAADATAQKIRQKARKDMTALLDTATNIAEKAKQLASRMDEKTTPTDLRALAETLDKLAGIFRKVGGIMTPAEETAREIGLAQVKLQQQRLELDKKRLEMGMTSGAEIAISGEAETYAD